MANSIFKDIEQIKAFILWAKEQKLSRIRIDKLEVEISQYALVENLINQDSHSLNTTHVPEKSPDEKREQEDNEILFHSSG